MMSCEQKNGILEEIDRISGLVKEDLQLADALETIAQSKRDEAIRVLASTLMEYISNLPWCLSELRDLVEGTTTEGCAI
jgi:hypothetical protein